MEDRPQKELFEFKDEKRPFAGIGRIFPKDAIGITLSLERMIFISIGLVLAMVLVYAIGVERGKSISVKSPSTPAIQQEPKPLAVSQKPHPSGAAVKPAERPGAPVSLPGQPKVLTSAIHAADKPYTIVAATFSRNDAASAAVNALRRNGFDAYLYQSGQYVQVSVGAFSTRAAGQAVLNRVKQRYKDAYFKLR